MRHPAWSASVSSAKRATREQDVSLADHRLRQADPDQVITDARVRSKHHGRTVQSDINPPDSLDDMMLWREHPGIRWANAPL